jgi:hypothetical protein
MTKKFKRRLGIEDARFWIIVLVTFGIKYLSDAFLDAPIKQVFPLLTDSTVRLLTATPAFIIGLALFWLFFLKRQRKDKGGGEET